MSTFTAAPRTRLALCQHASPLGESKDSIFARFAAMARDAVRDGAKVIMTQELFLAWYFCQGLDDARLDLAEPLPGPSYNRCAELARELGVVLHASLYECAAPGLHYNTSVTFGPDGAELGRYRKMHIPHDPRFEEKYYFAPGDMGFMVHRTSEAVLGPLVCWDQWYPEAARLTAMQGAQVLLYPTAIGWYNDPVHGEPADVREAQLDAWITIQRSHAIANGCFVAAANRVGVERDLTFWGSSFICGPDGRILAQASRDQDEVLVADLDFSRITAQRRGWPYFRDRRVDAYTPLTSRFLV
jgi:N-carbamoylputrescine amidase